MRFPRQSYVGASWAKLERTTRRQPSTRPGSFLRERGLFYRAAGGTLHPEMIWNHSALRVSSDATGPSRHLRGTTMFPAGYAVSWLHWQEGKRLRNSGCRNPANSVEKQRLKNRMKDVFVVGNFNRRCTVLLNSKDSSGHAGFIDQNELVSSDYLRCVFRRGSACLRIGKRRSRHYIARNDATDETSG